MIAAVGQASMQRVQVPQWSVAGSSDGSGNRGNHFAEQQPGAEPGVDDARVFANPADARAGGQFPLEDGGGIDAAARLGCRGPARGANRPARIGGI